jgi:predicted nuclease of predicted toxin-antitoxin system
MLDIPTNEIRLLLDENISPRITPLLFEAGIDALPLRDRAMLQISDHRVLTVAAKEGRAVTTINLADFEKLALKRKTHPGIIVIPSGGTREQQFTYITAAVDYLRQFPNPMAAARDNIIAVNEELRVSQRIVCAPASAHVQLAIVPKKA